MKMAFAAPAQSLPPAQLFPPPSQRPLYYYPLGPQPSWTQAPNYPGAYFPTPPAPPPTCQYGQCGSYPISQNGGFQNHYQPRYPGPRPYFRGRGRGRGVSKSQDGASGGGGIHFECKACSKEYKSRETYNTHLESHRKCSKCDYSAVPKVLKEHELIHILPDCLKFYSPEEIQKWREDRKKNFPTAENIARKTQKAAEKTARGETALTPLHRYIRQLVGDDGEDRRGGRGKWRGRGRNRGCGGSRGRGGGRGRWSNPGEERNLENGDSEISNVSSSSGTPMATGHVTSDPMTSAERIGHSVTGKPATCFVTGDTSDNMDNSKDGLEDGECVPPEGILDAILTDTAGRQGRQCVLPRPLQGEGVTDTPSTEGREVVGHVGTRKRKQKWVSRRENKKRKFAVPKLEDVPIKKATLLEKLLASEVRKEQNILLQCIRYIVDTGFLGHRKPPGEAEAEGGHSPPGGVERDHSLSSGVEEDPSPPVGVEGDPSPSGGLWGGEGKKRNEH